MSEIELVSFRAAVAGVLDRTWVGASDDRTVWNDSRRVGRVSQALADVGLAEFGSGPETGGAVELVAGLRELGARYCPAPVLDWFLVNTATGGREPRPDVDAIIRDLRTGKSSVIVSFEALDSTSPGLTLSADGRLTGTLGPVLGASAATHVCIVFSDNSLALVAIDAEGIDSSDVELFGAGRASQLSFRGTEALRLQMAARSSEELLLLAQLGATATALGSAERVLSLAVEYAKVREQFGQPIGRFQAIQHKLANCDIAVRGAALIVQAAADRYDSAGQGWKVLAGSARVYANDALRQVALEVHHTFGAVGYAEEHEATLHFRVIHTEALRFGADHLSSDLLARHFLEDADGDFPEYDLGPEAEAFRLELGSWLSEHGGEGRWGANGDHAPMDREYDKGFASEVGKTGWLSMNWPPEHGGGGDNVFKRLAMLEEFARIGAPRVGAPVHATTIILHGTEAQQQKYLPEIATGGTMWGMSYSEPDAGSDLASLRTSAVRDGDEWVISGEKIWTTTYWGQYLFVAARTDPTASKRKGISLFIVPTDTPGITYRTMDTLYGGKFANILFDGVRVPADALLGAENDGWTVLTSALGTERGTVGAAIVPPLQYAFRHLCTALRDAATARGSSVSDPLIHHRVAKLAAGIEAARQLSLYCAQSAAENGGEALPGIASACKVFAGELGERLGEESLDLLGIRAAITRGSPGAIKGGLFEQRLRHSLMWVISVGTNEIQRNIIAQQNLGLPR